MHLFDTFFGTQMYFYCQLLGLDTSIIQIIIFDEQKKKKLNYVFESVA